MHSSAHLGLFLSYSQWEKERTLQISGRLHVRLQGSHPSSLLINDVPADIIVSLIIGVLLIATFLFWQAYLERLQDSGSSAKAKSFLLAPPLMRLSIWTRGGGKFAAIMAIALIEWAAFITFVFWLQYFYQTFKGFTPIQTTVHILPMFIMSIVNGAIVGLFVGRIPVVYLIGKCKPLPLVTLRSSSEICSCRNGVYGFSQYSLRDYPGQFFLLGHWVSCCDCRRHRQ